MYTAKIGMLNRNKGIEIFRNHRLDPSANQLYLYFKQVFCFLYAFFALRLIFSIFGLGINLFLTEVYINWKEL